MITKDQTEAASAALLHNGLATQAVQATKLARRRQALLAFRWTSIGAMVGYSLDELLGTSPPGQSSTWLILCIALALAIVTATEMRKS